MADTVHAKDVDHGFNGLNGNYDAEAARMENLREVRTAGSVAMTPELFEKLYLSPMAKVKGDLRSTFGNPTPIALVGFLAAISPLSCDLMGWRGAGGGGAASTGAFIFMGGLLMVNGGVLEFILGNSFPSIVFCTYGGFYFAYGATLIPSFAASSAYAPADAQSASEGLTTTGFNASFGFFLLFMGLMTTVFFICSLRTNVVFATIFLSLLLALYILAGAYFSLAMGHTDLGSRLIVGGGACAFVTALGGWYIFFAIMLAVVDFPVQLPVGDLSTVIKGKSQTTKSA